MNNAATATGAQIGPAMKHGGSVYGASFGMLSNTVCRSFETGWCCFMTRFSGTASPMTLCHCLENCSTTCPLVRFGVRVQA